MHPGGVSGLLYVCLCRTRRGDARNAAVSRGRAAGEDGGSQSGSDASDEEGSGPIPGSFPGEAQLGDVVEYPLSAAVKDRLNDGRVKGIALQYVYRCNSPTVQAATFPIAWQSGTVLAVSLYRHDLLFPMLFLGTNRPPLMNFLPAGVGFVVGRNKGESAALGCFLLQYPNNVGKCCWRRTTVQRTLVWTVQYCITVWYMTSLAALY